MKILLILNDAPYGSERTYNGLRLAASLGRSERASVRAFLIGDAAAAAHKGQKVPQGYYNVEVMLGAVSKHGGEIGVCSSCMDARGLREEDLIVGAHRSSMEELTRWTLEADRTLVF